MQILDQINCIINSITNQSRVWTLWPRNRVVITSTTFTVVTRRRWGRVPFKPLSITVIYISSPRCCTRCTSWWVNVSRTTCTIVISIWLASLWHSPWTIISRCSAPWRRKVIPSTIFPSEATLWVGRNCNKVHTNIIIQSKNHDTTNKGTTERKEKKYIYIHTYIAYQVASCHRT